MELVEYDTMARVEDSYWWYRGLRGLVARTLRRELAGRRPARILDDGCGTGGGMATLAAAFPGTVIVGADLARPAVGYSRRRGAGLVCQASANRLPFRDGAFDAVVIADVLNVAAVDDRAALGEAHRVLRPGGVLVANVPAFEWLRGAHDAAVHTARRYRRDQLGRLLTTAGFEVRRLTYWNTLLLPLALVVRRLRSGRGAGDARPRSDLIPLPRELNWLLTNVVVADTWLSARVRLPLGMSLFGVAVKP